MIDINRTAEGKRAARRWWNGCNFFRIVFSRWTLMAVLLAVGAVCLKGAFVSNKAVLEKRAKAIQDPSFRRFFDHLESDREKAALKVALDAYERLWGSTVWAERAAEALGANGAPRYYDLALLGMSIDTGEERVDFMRNHAGIYEMIVEMGYAGTVGDYIREMDAMRMEGGRDWRLARENPLAVMVHAAVRKTGRPDLWEWYRDNFDWCDDYLMGAQPDPAAGDVAEALVPLLEELRRRPSIYRDLRKEILASGDDDDGEDGLPAESFLSMAMGTVSQYGEVFDILAKEGAPFSEALDVLANNAADLDFDSPRETGAELANLHRNHPTIWETAAAPGGGGAVRLFQASPGHADAVLAAFGEVGVLPFLIEYYGESDALLDTAAEALHRYEAPGWNVLTQFKGNEEFRETLLMPEVGHLLIPFILLKGGDPEAVSRCREHPKLLGYYLNPDGSFKPEAKNLLEAMPMVGAIATVTRKWAMGDSVTLGEIGWAAWEVVDDALTVAAFVGTAGAATPALAAKEAGKETLKQGLKKGGKTLVRQQTKALTRAATRQAMKQGARQATKRVGTSLAKKEGRALVRKSLVRRTLQTGGKSAAWTMRVAGKPIRLACQPVAKGFTAWKQLSPQARKWILRGVATAMLAIEIFNRTLPMMAEALPAFARQVGETAGKAVHAGLAGLGEAIVAATAAALGFDINGLTLRLGRTVVGVLAVWTALSVCFRRGRRRREVLPT
jgi:hypothetical protein